MIEGEHVEQIADRHIHGNVWIDATQLGIGQIVAATVGQRLQVLVALDELNDGGMVVITVHQLEQHPGEACVRRDRLFRALRGGLDKFVVS